MRDIVRDIARDIVGSASSGSTVTAAACVSGIVILMIWEKLWVGKNCRRYGLQESLFRIILLKHKGMRRRHRRLLFFKTNMEISV